MPFNSTDGTRNASIGHNIAADLGLTKILNDLAVAVARVSPAISSKRLHVAGADCVSGTLLGFLDEKTRSEACANSIGSPLQLTPIEVERMSELSERNLGIGVPFRHPHFGALALLIAGPRIASLCEEASRGGSTSVSRELVIAGSIYKLRFWLDGLRAEVFVDPAFPTVSEYEMDLTASWLQARFESELMAWGLMYSG